jgi:hypothetical protein
VVAVGLRATMKRKNDLSHIKIALETSSEVL